MQERSVEAIAADIVTAQAEDGLVPVDLYQEGTLAGLNVEALIERAEDLYELANETLDLPEGFDFD